LAADANVISCLTNRIVADTKSILLIMDGFLIQN